MNAFICNVCNSELKTKYTYLRHLKNHLTNYSTEEERLAILEEIECIHYMDPIKNYECEYCHKKYTRQYTLDRHIETSCENNKPFNQIMNLIAKYKHTFSRSEINQLINELDSSPKTESTKIEGSFNNNTTNTNSNNVNANNINLQINIQETGRENTEMIDSDEYLNKIMLILNNKENLQQSDDKKMRKALLKTFEEVNCNKDYPENHNIYKPNKSPYSPYEVFKNGRWITSKDHDLVKEIIKNTNDYVVGILNRKEDTEEVQNDFDNNYRNPENIKPDVCQDVLMRAYDYRDIIKDTYKKTKKPLNLSRKITNR